jgi:hypothetical protein
MLLLEFALTQEIATVDSSIAIIGPNGGKAVLQNHFEIHFKKGAFKKSTSITIRLIRTTRMLDSTSEGHPFYEYFSFADIYPYQIHVNFGHQLPLSDSIFVCLNVSSFLNHNLKRQKTYYYLFVPVYQVDIGPVMEVWNTQINNEFGQACCSFPVWDCLYNLWTHDSTYETVIGFAGLKKELIQE